MLMSFRVWLPTTGCFLPSWSRRLRIFYICAKLLPIIRSVAAAEGTDVVLISDGTRAEHLEFLRNHPLQNERYVVSAEIGMRYQISKVPYGVLLDADGVILGKGLCNTREHVESLFETVREGHSTLQDFMKHSMTPVEQADQNKGVH
jgi:methylamine dehydrogenase accessory protein MauD